jgi:methenyltetrahydromethanopterin cyclohydrolase
MQLPTLNAMALSRCSMFENAPNDWGVTIEHAPCGTRIIDCGVNAPGSERAGIQLVMAAMSGLCVVSVELAGADVPATQEVHVSTRSPLHACMASQYAGWQIKEDGYFAMGSGPMRAAAAREPLFAEIGFREQADACVGLLETSKIPPDSVCRDIAAKCNISPDRLTLLVARTSSIAGTIQIVGRSIETALHKLHTLGFDLKCIDRGTGQAPLPPVAKDDLTAIGWTNDAILYGGGVLLSMDTEDSILEELGRRVPSNASPDHGRPFAEIFARYNHDFYKIDPMLFSPAVVILHNNKTGNTYKYGNLEYGVLAESFSAKK